MACLVTGEAFSPDGTVFANGTVRFTRRPALGLPQIIAATTETGQISVTLDPGEYAVQEDVTGAFFVLDVPNVSAVTWSVLLGLQGTENPGTPGPALTVEWGEITGALRDQGDLATALDGKSDIGHTHDYSELTGAPVGGTAWGEITGNIADQTDLAAALASAGSGALENEFRLTEYLHPDDLAAALRGDTTAQDASRVTAAVQACHDAMMAWWSQSGPRIASVVYPPGTLAVNDEMFSEAFAQTLWTMGFSSRDRRVYFVGAGTTFKLKGWTARAAVRTSGRYAGVSHAVPKAVFRWEAPSAYANAPNLDGFGILGEENFATDPIGIFSFRSNVTTWRNIKIDRVANHAVVIFNMFNSRVHDLEIGDCGFQPTEYGFTGFLPETVTFSSVGATVTASQAVFDASHVGRSFGLAGGGAVQGGIRQIHWSPIASVVSATQITLTTAPATDTTSQRGSFESVRATTTVDSATITLSVPFTESANLVGRYVTIVGSGQSGVIDDQGNLTSVVIAHSGNTITTAQAARFARSNVAVCFGAGLSVTGLADAGDLDRTDDVTFHDARIENGAWMPVGGAVSALLSDLSSVDFTGGSKFHGASGGNSNFGGNFANVIINRALNLRLTDCTFTHSGHSTRFGKIMFTGDEVSCSITGGDVGYPDGTHTAWLYSSMLFNPTVAQIRYGLVRIAPLSASQVNLRLGGSATSAPFFTANSNPVSREGGEEIADLKLRLSGTPTGSAVVASGTDTTEGRLITVGYGGNTGSITPPLVADLDAVAGQHRRVLADASTVGAPDGLGGWVVDNIHTGSGDLHMAFALRDGVAPVMMLRHNANAGGGWSEWSAITGGAPSPTAPAQVTGLTATTGSSPGTLDAVWTVPADGGSAITGYLFEYRTGGGAYTAVTLGNVTSRTQTGLTEGAAYDVRVSAINAVGTGTASTVATATAGAAAGATVSALFLGQSEIEYLFNPAGFYQAIDQPAPGDGNLTIIWQSNPGVAGSVRAVNPTTIAAGQINPAMTALSAFLDFARPGYSFIVGDGAVAGTSRRDLTDDSTDATETNERRWGDLASVVTQMETLASGPVQHVIECWYNADAGAINNFKSEFWPIYFGANADGSPFTLGGVSGGRQVDHCLWDASAATGAKGRGLFARGDTEWTILTPMPFNNAPTSPEMLNFSANAARLSEPSRATMRALAGDALAGSVGLTVGPSAHITRFGGASTDFHPDVGDPDGQILFMWPFAVALLRASGMPIAEPAVVGCEGPEDGTYADLLISLPNGGNLTTLAALESRAAYSGTAPHQQAVTGIEMTRGANRRPVYRTTATSYSDTLRGTVVIQSAGETHATLGRVGRVRVTPEVPFDEGNSLSYLRGQATATLQKGRDEFLYPYFLLEHIPALYDAAALYKFPGVAVRPFQEEIVVPAVDVVTPPVDFVARSVAITGDDALTNDAIAITGGPRGMFSGWVKMTGTWSTSAVIWELRVGTTTFANLTGFSAGRAVFRLLQDGTGSDTWNPPSGTFVGDTWYHIAWSWDYALARFQVYINGTALDTSAYSFTGSTEFAIDGAALTRASFGAGALLANFVTGEMAHMYLNLTQSLDLSNPTNLAKFISGGAPVDMGAEGELVTGTAPHFYIDGAGSAWNNQGTNGPMTVTGALTPGSTPAVT